MRPFLWKIVICVTPCLLAAWVTTVALTRYYQGQSGGFKLGVDLVGGTILVYEIDTRKQLGGDAANPQRDTQLLADSLKKRIDPTDTYNIVIRPAGGEGRVEIILPTGGKYRSAAAEEAWQNLLKKLKEPREQGGYDLKEKPEVPRGHVLELAEAIQTQKAREKWQSAAVFGNPAAWNELIAAAFKNDVDWPRLRRVAPFAVAATVGLSATPYDALSMAPVYRKGIYKTEMPQYSVGWSLLTLKPGDLAGLKDKLMALLGADTSEKTIEGWIKRQAWDRMLAEARKTWPELQRFLLDPVADKAAKQEGEQGLKVEVLPDRHEELIALIQTKGNTLSAAGLTSLQPLLGTEALNDKDFVPYDTARKFIEDNYGPSLNAITKDITSEYRRGGMGKDLTVEEVQRIKDLVARVGALEFRIVANNKDDVEAIRDAKEQIKNDRAKLDEYAQKGVPPPGPLEAKGSGELQPYNITLARGEGSRVTYSWVELGPQARRDYGLDNAAENDPSTVRNRHWQQARALRDGHEAGQLLETGQLEGTDKKDSKFILNGALFYSRRCEDRNLPEEERKAKQYEYFVLCRDPEFDPTDQAKKRRVEMVGGKYLTGAAADRQGVSPAVTFQFNSKGGELFGELTRKNIPDTGTGENKRHLAIVLDGLIMSAPTINSQINDRGQITGSFTPREVDALVNILRSGALPASLKPQPVSESTLGATLGEDTINAGIWAIGASFLAVVIFMMVYYRFAGFVASVALFANLLLTVGFMIAVQATFTLPGLAGLVLMLGMAVDANVLIYERLREERDRGASLALAIRNGYDRAFPTIIDTHLSSIFTAIVLYVVGNDQLKGFGVSLTVGLIISLFTSLYMTRLIFDVWLNRGWLKKLSMLRMFSRPDIDFMGIRYYFFGITIAVSVLGVAVFIGRLPNDLNIDFRGGTAYGGRFVNDEKEVKDFRDGTVQTLKNDKSMDITELRDLVDEANQRNVLKVAEVTEDEQEKGRRYGVRYEGESVFRPVSLANEIRLPSAEDRLAEVKKRASQLPDPAVEQTFPSFDVAPSGKSHFFTVRTTEKETELVQTVLDRLMHDKDGNPLLQKVYIVFEEPSRTGVRLHALKKDPKGLNVSEDAKKDRDKRFTEIYRDYASPSFVKTLLVRELKRIPAFVESSKTVGGSDRLKFQVEVTGEGASREGRFATLKVAFIWPKDMDKPETLDERMKNVTAALQQTANAFQSQPQPERLENFDSQLAAETRVRAMWAVIASWGAIALYLWFRFGNWTFGLAAVLCLVHDLFFTLGIIAACHYVYDTWFGQMLKLEDFKIDLPAVAALLTLVGYSVNDTIVVFDRIREVRGKNPDLTPQMINDSVNQTLSRTLLTSFVTWLVVAVLYWWGGPGVHLFAFVMVVGVIVGTYSSIYIASPLLLIFGEGAPETGGRRVRQPTPQPAPA